MLKQMKPHGLTAALLALLPAAIMAQIDREDWYSATFCGERVTIKLFLPGQDMMDQVTHFSRDLPDYEFTLHRWCVADILVKRYEKTCDGIMIFIEALLIEE
jgi:hypothetical protein